MPPRRVAAAAAAAAAAAEEAPAPASASGTKRKAQSQPKAKRAKTIKTNSGEKKSAEQVAAEAKAKEEAKRKEWEEEMQIERNNIIKKRVEEGSALLTKALPLLLGPQITHSELKALDDQYRSTPERNWPMDAETLKCAYDDTKRDDVLWTTTKKLVDIVAPRTTEAYEAGIKVIQDGTIDIKHVDCYLPVYRNVKDCYCMDCRHGSTALNTGDKEPSKCRKMSMLRLWVGSAGGNLTKETLEVLTAERTEVAWNERYCKDDLQRVKTLDRFLRLVLLPTGLATRYNQVFHCRKLRALELAVELEYREGSHPFCHIGAVMMLLHAMPTEAKMECKRVVRTDVYSRRPEEWYEERGRYLDHHRIYACTDVPFVKSKLALHAS